MIVCDRCGTAKDVLETQIIIDADEERQLEPRNLREVKDLCAVCVKDLLGRVRDFLSVGVQK